MGILADVVVAPSEGALAYKGELAAAIARNQISDGVAWKGFTSLEFGLLWADLESREWSPEVHTLLEVRLEPPYEQWLLQFPPELVSLLSQLSDSAIPEVANRWAEREDIRAQPKELEPILRELRRLAAWARQSGQGMFLWGSL